MTTKTKTKRAPRRTTKRATVKPPANGVLIMRTVRADGVSHGGFRWPLEVGATVEAPDWNPEPVCGGGLHGFLRGEGDGGLADWSETARWLVVEADASDVVEIDKAKCKCRRCVVVHVGDRVSATSYIQERCPGAVVVGGTASVGDRGTASAGHGGTASVGDRGTASAGDMGTASAGDMGTASVGDRGTASAGHGGTASAGYMGTASAGRGGTASVGDMGTLIVRWWDDVAQRYRVIVGYPGEDGIEAGKKYRHEGGRLVPAEPEEAQP